MNKSCKTRGWSHGIPKETSHMTHVPTRIGASGESKRDIGKLRDEVQVMGGKTI